MPLTNNLMILFSELFINDEVYIYLSAISLSPNNINYDINKNVQLLTDTRKCMSRMNYDLWRRMKGKPVLLNYVEGLNTLDQIMQKNKNITKTITKFVFDIANPYDLSKIIVTYIDFNTFEPVQDPIIGSNATYDERIKLINALNYIGSSYSDPSQIQVDNNLSVVYFDNYKDYASAAICHDINGSIVTIYAVEFTIQDVITTALNVKGDSQIYGDLMVSNQNNNENFVSIDPIQKFVGINTDERDISYRDITYSTASGNLYNSKHLFHVLNDKFPVMVSERIQENINDISDSVINPRYFGTYSALNAKRRSNLYNFNEINDYSKLLDDSVPENDKVTHFRYGPDIAFEVCDNTDRSVELGQIQMTIDSIDPSGHLNAGFGVQVLDAELGSSFETSRRNIMYVDNSGTLFINKIVLGGKTLETDNDGNLLWDGKKVALE